MSEDADDFQYVPPQLIGEDDLGFPHDKIIEPEIKDDEFYRTLRYLAKHIPGKAILEIGSSAGGGSTEALVAGIVENGAKPNLYCMEVSKPRCELLRQRYADVPQVVAYNTSSVSLSRFPTEEYVYKFCMTTRNPLNNLNFATIAYWLRRDRAYIEKHGCDEDGILRIKAERNIDTFDMVLIDGSEFTGEAEFELVYGAPVIALDDIKTFKNCRNHKRLMEDPSYEIAAMNLFLRGGFSVFIRR